MTVSEFARGEIAERLGVPPSGSPWSRTAWPSASAARADPGPARAALGLERPYVLALATRIARKNLGALADRGASPRGRGDRAASRRARDAATCGRASRAPGRALGYVPDAHLPGLYAGAAAFAMPSLYEGFGLPVLEAMAAGTPVVAADRAALPEVCGGAALLADPDDPEAFADALLRATGPERERLAAAGRERAAGFTWERSARLADAAMAGLLA